MSTFIGLDLAWTAHNESGICWLVGETSADLTCTRFEAKAQSTEDLADEIAEVPGTVVVTIDAPLLYTADRWVEKEIGRQFSRYKASAHSAHAAVRRGWRAGIDLGLALKDRGFTLDPAALRQESDCRVAVEVYPHTIHVRLFDLTERLPYKAKRRRPVAYRRRIFNEYQDHLRALTGREAPGILGHPDVQHALKPQTAQEAKGAGLKRLEDKLDGLTCALAAWLAWSNPMDWEPIGDMNGNMVVPLPASALPPTGIDLATIRNAVSEAKDELELGR